jgi:hypothetical protein
MVELKVYPTCLALGKKPIYDPVATRKSILELLGTPPPFGQAKWDGKSVAKALNISDDKVR